MSRCEHCKRDLDEVRQEQHRLNNLALIKSLTEWLQERGIHVPSSRR